MKITKTNVSILGVALFLALFPFAIDLISTSYRPIPLIICWSALALFLTVLSRRKGAKKAVTMKDRLVSALGSAGGGLALCILLNHLYWGGNFKVTIVLGAISVPMLILMMILYVRK